LLLLLQLLLPEDLLLLLLQLLTLQTIVLLLLSLALNLFLKSRWDQVINQVINDEILQV
jgi:hypothetical protein